MPISLTLTKTCPQTAIVYSKGTPVYLEDYSYQKSVSHAVCAFVSDLEQAGHEITQTEIARDITPLFTTHTREEILSAAYNGEAWPLLLNFVEVAE